MGRIDDVLCHVHATTRDKRHAQFRLYTALSRSEACNVPALVNNACHITPFTPFPLRL